MTAPQTAASQDFAVQYRDLMVQSLAMEMETTRKVLAALPESGRNYKPDPKARSAWELAWHIASVDVQFTSEIAEGKFSMEPRFKEEPKDSAALADWYEKGMKASLERVRNMTPEQLTKNLDFFGAFNLPAYMYLSFVEKHSIHHRGQLSSYLRPAGGKVPSIYGGSADEEWVPPTK